MKRIKTFLPILLVFTAFFANAQIKVHSDNHISIGSLGKTYGLQVHPNGYTYFSNPNSGDVFTTMSNVSNYLTKSWIVHRVDNSIPDYVFYVNGQGDVYRHASYTINNPIMMNITGPIVNPTNALGQINGFYYTLVDRGDAGNDRLNVGLSAEEIEKVIPEAVVTTEEGEMCINYEVLTVFLVEAVKEQQNILNKLSSQYNELYTYMDRTNPTNKSKLYQNHPNPFDNECIIDYYLDDNDENAEIIILNMVGETLKVYKLVGHGMGNITIDSDEFKNGLYYYCLVINNIVSDTKKMIISK